MWLYIPLPYPQIMLGTSHADIKGINVSYRSSIILLICKTKVIQVLLNNRPGILCKHQSINQWGFNVRFLTRRRRQGRPKRDVQLQTASNHQNTPANAQAKRESWIQNSASLYITFICWWDIRNIAANWQNKNLIDFLYWLVEIS